MINSSRASSSTGKESLYWKRSGGKVRLPPLSSTRQLIAPSSQQGIQMKSNERRPSGVSITSNLSSPFLAENFLTPIAYKCPMSPSNLSLQFNFEADPRHTDETGGNGPFDEDIDVAVKAASSKNGSLNRAKSSMLKTQRNGRNNKPKGYSLLSNEELLGENQTGSGSARRKSTTGTSIKRKTISRNTAAASPRSPEAKSYTDTAIRLDVEKNTERKRSTYDLREFLTLPSKSEHRISSTTNSISPSSLGSKPKQPGEKRAVKISNKTKPSDDSTYDVFEFLALPTDSQGQKNLKELQSQKIPREKSIKSTKKPDIPSVIVADWSLKDECSGTKRLIHTRPSRELPKTNFPSDDFPQQVEQQSTLETHASRSAQRNSVYDLKGFLMLPDATRLHSVQKVKPGQDVKPRSSSLDRDSTRETDAKYDLAEFLNFLEKGGSSLQANTHVNHERTTHTTNLGLQNRSLSVYDIYEFLKTSNSKELAAGVDDADDTASKPSIVDVPTFVAKSSPNTVPPLNVPTTSDEKSSQASRYDLREFLRQSGAMESNQNEAPTRRGTAGRLKIN